MSEKQIENAPNRIFLLMGSDTDVECADFDAKRLIEGGEVCWQTEPEDNYDVEYLRADSPAIAAALNFQHVTFPAMVAKVREELKAFEVQGLTALVDPTLNGMAMARYKAFKDFLDILEANNENS